ncbi:MAG: UDP-3-O-acyl-N-acetylglucosamine deacetylase [Planctomycetota bacterium]|nr:UDP-3-O-acyl-N-acetylglucosamine deacetylase [Planctomycetota bacterium]
MFRNQTTLSGPVQLSGTGYWSGLKANLEFRPALPNAGITFVRRDLAGQPRIAVDSGNCVDIPRRTCMQSGAASVEMIEHIMAALAGLRIDNCEVWVDRAEMPAFDGSSLMVTDALGNVPRVDQGVARPSFVIEEAVRIEKNGSWIEALPSSGLEPVMNLKYQLDYEASVIGKQEIEIVVTPESFVTELAPARTFLLDVEANWLRSQGLGRSVSFQDILVFGPNGVIDNELRFENECVRHKALDVVGDLAVAGFDIIGNIVAHKSGHQLNGEFVRKLIQAYSALPLTKKSA